MSSAKRVLVLGAGPGGYPAAFLAADLGFHVTLVDEAPLPGGVCLHRGCIPSKTLLHLARVITEAREASSWGVRIADISLDLERARAATREVISKLASGLQQLGRRRRVEYVQGRGLFRSDHVLEVRLPDGSMRTLEFDYAVVATGSRPATLPNIPASPRIWDSTAALQLEGVPPTLLVIGGGYIGLELGSVYAAFGSRVTVVEMLPQLLSGADADLVRPLAKKLEKTFAAVHLGARVVSVEDTGASVRVRWVTDAGVARAEEFDRVLVAVGRKPNSEQLGLERIGVALTERGFVRVDEQRRTSVPHIFAVGDVAGEPLLAHKATHEGRVAVEAIAGRKTAFDARAVPGVVFTDPELAWCGLTESEATGKGVAVKAAVFPWSASGRALTFGRTEGLTKLICEATSGRVLGAGLCGAGAGELISECALAIEMGAMAEDLARTIHPHPTLSETVMEAAEVFLGHCTHWLIGSR